MLLKGLLVAAVLAADPSDRVMGAEEVVHLALAQDLMVKVAEKDVLRAQASQVEAGLYPNPTLGWEHESLEHEEQNFFRLSLPVELSTARNTRVRLAKVLVSQERATLATVRSQRVVYALHLFYRLIYLQERARVQKDAVVRLEEGVRVVARRREEGHASGYDEARLRVEKDLAASDLRQTKAAHEGLALELRTLLGQADERLRFEGSLRSDPELSLMENPKDTVALKHFARATKEGARAARSARWAWVPRLVLGGGPILATGHADHLGYTLGVQLELPFFARGQELSAQAQAIQARSQAIFRARQQQISIAQKRAHIAYRAARVEVEELQRTAEDRVRTLERAAQSGYREGRLTVVDLLDAQEARTHVELHRLELALALKKAEIEVRAARGDYQ